jgi:hypothetical protein
MMRAPALLGALALAACNNGETAPQNGDVAAPGAGVEASATAASSPVPTPDAQDVAPCDAVFSCTVEGGTRLQVCKGDDARLTYRFGPQDAPELQIAAPARWASVAYAGGGEAQIAFAREGYDYIVFSRIVRTGFSEGQPNDPEMTDGVIVRRAGEDVATRTCMTDRAIDSVDVNALGDMAAPEGELFAQ